jgi:hypothetical protein
MTLRLKNELASELKKQEIRNKGQILRSSYNEDKELDYDSKPANP